jgi:hypothetical protein
MEVGTKKGVGVLNDVLSYNLIVVNTLFRKRISSQTFSND